MQIDFSSFVNKNEFYSIISYLVKELNGTINNRIDDISSYTSLNLIDVCDCANNVETDYNRERDNIVKVLSNSKEKIRLAKMLTNLDLFLKNKNYNDVLDYIDDKFHKEDINEILRKKVIIVKNSSTISDFNKDFYDASIASHARIEGKKIKNYSENNDDDEDLDYNEYEDLRFDNERTSIEFNFDFEHTIGKQVHLGYSNCSKDKIIKELVLGKEEISLVTYNIGISNMLFTEKVTSELNVYRYMEFEAGSNRFPIKFTNRLEAKEETDLAQYPITIHVEYYLNKDRKLCTEVRYRININKDITNYYKDIEKFKVKNPDITKITKYLGNHVNICKLFCFINTEKEKQSWIQNENEYIKNLEKSLTNNAVMLFSKYLENNNLNLTELDETKYIDLNDATMALDYKRKTE